MPGKCLLNFVKSNLTRGHELQLEKYLTLTSTKSVRTLISLETIDSVLISLNRSLRVATNELISVYCAGEAPGLSAWLLTLIMIACFFKIACLFEYLTKVENCRNFGRRKRANTSIPVKERSISQSELKVFGKVP